MQHGGATVRAGIPRCYPGCLRWCPGNCHLRHGNMPVGPRSRPGATLHYKTRIKNGVTSVFFCLYRITVMTQIGLHSHIRVTRGIMICVAKQMPSNLAAHLHDK